MVLWQHFCPSGGHDYHICPERYLSIWGRVFSQDGYVPSVCPVFSEFQYKLTHGGSLLYSWDIGMGVNFSALYAYYLASPVNWLLILCPKKFIIEFMTILIVLKTGLSGLSFSWYLKKHFGVKKFGVGFLVFFMPLAVIWLLTAGTSCGWTASCCSR